MAYSAPSQSVKDQRRILITSVIGNGVALTIFVCVFAAFAQFGVGYCRFGPNEQLVLLSVTIDTWERWCVAMAFISTSAVVDVLVNEFASPILGFSVYNPDKTLIKGYTRNELQLLTNTQFFINSARQTLSTLFLVTQLDFALVQLVARELTTVFTIRKLLKNKIFLQANPFDDDDDDDNHQRLDSVV